MMRASMGIRKDAEATMKGRQMDSRKKIDPTFITDADIATYQDARTMLGRCGIRARHVIAGWEDLQDHEFLKYNLTPRERQIARRILGGLTYGQIAHELRFKESTVKYHVTNLFKKVDVHTRSEFFKLIRSGMEHSKYQWKSKDPKMEDA